MNFQVHKLFIDLKIIIKISSEGDLNQYLLQKLSYYEINFNFSSSHIRSLLSHPQGAKRSKVILHRLCVILWLPCRNTLRNH
jgi:hypothetical protein